MSSRTILLAGLLFLLFSPFAVLAQIGIKAGPGISDIVFLEEGQAPYLGYEVDYLEHRKPVTIFQAGLFSTFNLLKRLDFQPELLYITQGLDYSIQYPYDDITYKLKISYLQTPFLLKYQLGPNKKSHPALLAGPYASLKIKAVRDVKIGGRREKGEMSNVNPTDFGVIAGFSTEFNLPGGQIVLDLRTSYSLVNMMNRVEGYVPEYNGPKKEYIRNISIVLAVGYRFLNLQL